MGRGKIKILQLTTEITYAGGVQVILNLASKIDRERFEFVICSLGIHRQESMVECFRELGIEVIDLKATTKFNLLIPLYKLYKLLKKRKDITILHSSGHIAGAFGRVIGKLAGVPIIMTTAHSPEHTCPIRRRLPNILTLNLDDCIVCVSEYVKDSWKKLPFSENVKMVVIHNGIDVAKFDNISVDFSGKRRELGLSKADIVIGNVSRLDPDAKGQDDLIKAHKIVTTREPKAKLLLVGDGRPEAEYKLESLVRSLGLQHSVVFAGRRNDIPEILQIMDIFAFPSIFEGFGIALIEAMAAGKPVITSDIEPLNRIVEDGKTGKLVPCRDANTLADAILQLIANPNLANKMGKAAYKRVKEHFSLEQMARKYEELYESLATGKYTSF